MERDGRISRRLFLGGGLVLIGCGGIPAAEEPEQPLAQWPEDDNMPQRLPPTPEPAGDLTQPLILYGSVLAQPNVDNSVPNEQLANPFQIPMEILAVRFRLTPEPDPTAADDNARVIGGAVKVKFDVGAASVASDIPIAMFGDMRDTYEAQNAEFFPGIPFTGASVVPTTYDWRFKYPLFIPPGKVMTAVFTPIGLNPLPVRVDVIYICRSWDVSKPEPKKVKVPWAASFESKTFKYEDAAPADQAVSSNLDVLNPFGVPLELSRISGRCSRLNLSASVGGVLNSNYIFEDKAEFRQVLSTMRMRSSRGFDLIRTPVPFDGVFPVNWRSWEILDGWSMAPQEYYRVQIDTIAMPYTISVDNVGTAQFAVGIVGYRDVEVKTLRGET